MARGMSRRGLKPVLIRFHTNYTAYPAEIHDLDSRIAISSAHQLDLIFQKAGMEVQIEDEKGKLYRLAAWLKVMLGALETPREGNDGSNGSSN